jgi:hypothetical protein
LEIGLQLQRIRADTIRDPGQTEGITKEIRANQVCDFSYLPARSQISLNAKGAQHAAPLQKRSPILRTLSSLRLRWAGFAANPSFLKLHQIADLPAPGREVNLGAEAGNAKIDQPGGNSKRSPVLNSMRTSRQPGLIRLPDGFNASARRSIFLGAL